MKQNDAIGGYFELELKQGTEYHADAIALNSARNCLEYILLTRKYKKVYIPWYTCEVVLEPFHKHNVNYEFYSINELLEPANYPKLASNEAFLYTNYFGLKQKAVEKVASLYGTQTIIDNAQAFYAPPLPSIDTFYSPRKFFGVPDGGYLYTDTRLAYSLKQTVSWQRMQHLVRRIDEGAEAGYADFCQNDNMLSQLPLLRMSKLTHAILKSIDYTSTKINRQKNYHTLLFLLHNINHLQLQPEAEDVPMVYPLLAEDHNLRTFLISKRIYIASYWKNVIEWCPAKSLERKLAINLLPLPISQAYSTDTMEFMANLINTFPKIKKDIFS